MNVSSGKKNFLVNLTFAVYISSSGCTLTFRPKSEGSLALYPVCRALTGTESKETLKEVNHPNIAMIHAIEEIDGEIFIVMEFIDGQELRARIEEGPILSDSPSSREILVL